MCSLFGVLEPLTTTGHTEHGFFENLKRSVAKFCRVFRFDNSKTGSVFPYPQYAAGEDRGDCLETLIRRQFVGLARCEHGAAFLACL